MPLLATDVATTVDGPVRAEVAAALAELGYAAEEIRSALSEVASGGDVQETLRRALRELSRS
jgi:Holliday junction resolvasome RuvABC DNA-binding subunit